MSDRYRSLAYWAATILLATGCLVGGVMGALHWHPFVNVIRHLGYPTYLMTILGFWYVLGGLALLLPGLSRVKEWAYAGLMFNCIGALASHAVKGDGPAMLVAPCVFAALTLTSWAFRPLSRREPGLGTLVPSSSARFSRVARIAYWITTVLVTAELALGGVWDILRISAVRPVVDQLGYPEYFLVIIGVGKVPGAMVLLVPRIRRLKEWAYAGAMFIYTGAMASHVLAAFAPVGELTALVCFASLTVASYLLHPGIGS